MTNTSGRISIELVPRNTEALLAECEAIRARLPVVDTVNIPDLLRFDLRSWDACGCVRQHYPRAIPHLRAIDVDLKKPLIMAPILRKHGFNEVLIVTGDAPADMSRVVYPTSSTDLIHKFKREMPDVTVYAAMDPYRHGFRDEYDYVRRKMDAGADGFFTQPFFDLRLMEMWAELLADYTVFWGVTPVLANRSKSYWETRNRAVFPADFRPTLDWNRAFARQALEFVRSASASVYFMPIKVDAVAYLEGIL